MVIFYKVISTCERNQNMKSSNTRKVKMKAEI